MIFSSEVRKKKTKKKTLKRNSAENVIFVSRYNNYITDKGGEERGNVSSRVFQ